MKNFTLVHETPDHFVLHNGRAHFHVAKSGIDQPTADKIRSLANGGKATAGNITQKENQKAMNKIDKKIASKNYADGGMVQSPEEARIEAAEKARRAQKKQVASQDEPFDYVKYNNPDKFAKGGPVPAAVVNPPAKTPDVASPTDTKTQTGGSSPGGASTGGIGSGLGGAGTGGAATGGASTGGAGTITVTVSGKTNIAKGGITISGVGGKTEAGNVASGDGPGAPGSGGHGKGSPGGNGGAPDEPKGFSNGGDVQKADGGNITVEDPMSLNTYNASTEKEYGIINRDPNRTYLQQNGTKNQYRTPEARPENPNKYYNLAEGGDVEKVSDDVDMYKHGMDVTSEDDTKKYQNIKQLSQETGLPKFDDGGDVQSFQDSFRKATHYDDGGAVEDQNPGFFESVKKAFKTPEPTPTPEPSQDAKYEAIRKQNRQNMQGGSNYARGGPVASNAVKDISHETQSQAIGRYAAGNPANYATGGHVHHNGGKNQLHFHFYDGASIPSSLDKYVGGEPNPGPSSSPLDTYEGGAPANEMTALDNYDEGGTVTLSPQDIDPNANLNTGATPLQQQMKQADENPTPEQSANNLANAMGQPEPFESTTAPNPNATPTTVAPDQQVKVAQTPPPAPGMNLMNELSQATEAQKSALQAGENAKADYFDTQKDIVTNQMAKQQQLYNTYQQTQKDDEAQLKTLFDGVKNSKVDPNRYWNNKSTGSKIAAGIGLLLGGISQGLGGGPNPAIAAINQHIQQDIDAQKNDQTNNVNMYKIGLQKYRDDQAAYNFATLNANAMVAGQLQKAAATAGSAQAKAAAQMGIAQITQQSIPLQQQLAMHQVAMQMTSGGTGTKNINPEALPEDMRDRAVRLPNGNLGLSPTKEDAAIARKSFTSLSGMNQQLDQFLNTMKKIGPTVNPWGADAATSEAARQNIVLELNNLHGLNRLNDNEFKTYMSMVPTAGTWRPNRATAQIMALKQLVKNKEEGEMTNNIEGYKTPKLTPGAPK